MKKEIKALLATLLVIFAIGGIAMAALYYPEQVLYTSAFVFGFSLYQLFLIKFKD